ncbi:MAG: YebC/PmpR family DNA-binding transcriptional regulator [Chloroflexi bacterium]|nr:YebC/PmpR family DNA-binding transcriptional regulator [Chloroflexota bacterium]
MSGHSKWSQIKRQKGAADAKRGQLFTKLGREISVAARDGGGPDPDANARLRLAVQRAREANMPMDTIDRAIKRGAGGGDAAALQEILYEGYGPNGAAILIEAMTDNRNRTVAEIRNAFKSGGGSLGEAGCVAWLFDNRGVISLQPNGEDPDEVALKAIDAGADDFRVDDDGIEIYTEPASLDSVRSALEQDKLQIANAELAMIPKTTLELQPKETVTVLKLMERLEELDDVQRVYSNVELSEEALSEYA